MRARAEVEGDRDEAGQVFNTPKDKVR